MAFKGFRRKEWAVCRVEDREALSAIGERWVRDWRDGEPVTKMRVLVAPRGEVEYRLMMKRREKRDTA